MHTFMEFQYFSKTDGDHRLDTIENKLDLQTLLNQQVTENIDTIMSQKGTKSQSPFQIKFEFPNIRNDILEVYYISPCLVCLTCCLNICHINSNTYLYRIEKTEHYIKGKKWHYLGTIHKKTINRSFNSSITFTFKYVMAPENIKYDHSEKNVTPNVQLANDFEHLLNNKLFSDITMKSTEGTEFKLHKNILAARSEVLKANFEHNTTECYTNIIESPLEADVLQEVLTFIYTDKAPGVYEIPEKLLAAADYYQLEGLKVLCEEPLYKKLTIKNVIETLELADLHSARVLKQKILKFIKESPMVKIKKTEGWSNIKSVELVKCICEYIAADDFNN